MEKAVKFKREKTTPETRDELSLSQGSIGWAVLEERLASSKPEKGYKLGMLITTPAGPYKYPFSREHFTDMRKISPSVENLNPWAGDLTEEQRKAILEECRKNPWYFFNVLTTDLGR